MSRGSLRANRTARAWSDVWRLYLENVDVFRAAVVSLRRTGVFLPEDLVSDFVHEFLVTRAPDALATFRPARGELRPWLFVVFRRYVLGTYRSQRRVRAALEALQEEMDVIEVTSGPDEAADLSRVADAIEHLPRERQQVLYAFFGAKASSIRATARELGLSRWKASRVLLEAVSDVAAQLGIDLEAEEFMRQVPDSGVNEPAIRDRFRLISVRLDRALRGPRQRKESQKSSGRGPVRPGVREMTNMDASVHRHDDPEHSLRSLLNSELPERIDPKLAEALLHHAATCDSCGAMLQERPAHAQMLLEASDWAEEAPADALDLVSAAQQELLVTGRAVLQHVPEQHRRAMRTELPLDRVHELWAVKDAPAEEIRCALAVSETALALRSVLASAKASVSTNGVEMSDGSNVPVRYFASRIAVYACVDPSVGEAVWSSVVQVLADGKSGLPGIHVMERSGKSISVRLVEE